MNLLDDENGIDNDSCFKINEDYAKRYDKWRKSEELQKLKDKYGEGYEEDSSSSEEEDEDATELTEEVEKDFFKTLSCLKEKNPKIYDENVRFFKEKQENDGSKVKKKKEESLTMAAYQRKLLLETNGILEEEDHSSNIEDLPPVEQERALKASFKAALKDSDSEEENEMGGLLKTKEKSKEERESEEADYRAWLAGQESSIQQNDQKDLKVLRDYWTDPKLDEGEKFLRDYILNHRYLEKDKGKEIDNFVSDSEEETVQKQEEFERKFNFRFEEPDQDFIKRYPRTVEQSMRRKDDRRKRHREEVKARKQAERAQKDEELKRLKALKRAEIMEKIKKLQEVTGNQEMTFQDNDIDGEFNPEDHDKRMAELFNEEYYGNAVDEEKPEFPDLDEELEIEKWDDWAGEKASKNPEEDEQLHCEDPGFVMDCDYDPNQETQRELIENSRRKRKRRQSKFAEAAARPKPVFDPTNQSFEKYLDEYYALDYEDLIGDIPCRFKYRKVVPNDYGLSIEEILSAPDKELNRWASVKKIMQRRPDHVELYDVKAYQRKASNIQKKMQCLPSIYAESEEENDDVPPVSSEPSVINETKESKLKNNSHKQDRSEDCQKMMNDGISKKKKKKAKEETNSAIEIAKPLAPVEAVKKQKKKKASEETNSVIDKAKPPAPVETVKKKKKKLKAKVNTVVETDVVPTSTEASKKRRKKKKKCLPIGTNDVISNSKNNKILREKENGASKKRKRNTNINEPRQSANTFKRKKIENDESISKNIAPSISDARLKSYGLNPRKFKNKLKYGPKH